MSFADRQGDKTIVRVVAMGPQADEADAGASEKETEAVTQSAELEVKRYLFILLMYLHRAMPQNHILTTAAPPPPPRHHHNPIPASKAVKP